MGGGYYAEPPAVSHYEVLGVSETASPEEVKRAFQRKALLSHPDKRKDGEANEAFRRVQEAWEVLREPGSRSEYDKSNFEASRPVVVSAEVRFEDMEDADCGEEEEDDAAYRRHACRCGDYYEISDVDIDAGDDAVIQCMGCSLYVRITRGEGRR